MNPNTWNSPVKTGNSVTLTVGEDERVFTGAQAQSLIMKLDNNEQLIPITNAQHVTQYIMAGKDCTWCVMATVTPTAAASTPVPCEDGLPNCANDPLNPTTPTIDITNAVVFVKVGSTVTLNVDTNQTAPAITWASADTATATVAAGVVTGVKVGTTTVTATLAGGQKASATINVIAADN